MNFGEVKKLKDGRYFSKMEQRFLLQLDAVLLNTPFDDSQTVTLQLNSSNMSKLNSVQDKVKTYATENSEKWFGKNLQATTIAAAFSGDTELMNVFKATENKKVVTRVYDAEKNLIEPGDVEVNSVCDVVLEMTGVWFLKKSFGISWKILQVRKRPAPKPKYYEEYLFSDDVEEIPEEEDEDDYV